MANFVLVHGGAHGGWCWRSVARLLRSAGHEVYTPTLTGLGERQHLLTSDTDLAMHVTDVVSVLRFEDLHDVILVGHSYGGMVITGAADQSLDRVRHLVYLDAAIPEDGEALIDWSPGLKDLAQADARTVDGVELVLWPTPTAFTIYGIEDPVLIAWMLPKLTPHPWKCFTQQLHLSHPDAIRMLPRTIINCTSTLKVRTEANLPRCYAAERVWEIDTGHDAMLTEPHRVAELLLGLTP